MIGASYLCHAGELAKTSFFFPFPNPFNQGNSCRAKRRKTKSWFWIQIRNRPNYLQMYKGISVELGASSGIIQIDREQVGTESQE